MLIFRKLIMSVIGSGILAFGIYNIHSVSNITEGGILGLALFLEHWFKISPAVSSAIISGVCYFLGYKILGKSFIIYSVASAGGFSLWYAVLERFPRVFEDIGSFPLAATVLGAVFVGVGVGICVKAGGAPTGDDALAMAFSKKLGTKIEMIYFVTDAVVLLMCATYIPISGLLYSVITVLLSGQIIGLVQKIKIKEI